MATNPSAPIGRLRQRMLHDMTMRGCRRELSTSTFATSSVSAVLRPPCRPRRFEQSRRRGERHAHAALGTRTGVGPEPVRRVELLSWMAGRRRFWSMEQKLAIVSEAQGCDNLTDLARRHDIRASQLYTWRRKLRCAGRGRNRIIRSAWQVALSTVSTSECRASPVPCRPVRFEDSTPTRGNPAVRPDVCRSPLALRNAEDLPFERGIELCHETVRFCWNRFGPMFAADIRRQHVSRMRDFTPWRWHVDEGYVKINGEMGSVSQCGRHRQGSLSALMSRKSRALSPSPFSPFRLFAGGDPPSSDVRAISAQLAQRRRPLVRAQHRHLS
jgi:transposase-like protein